MTELVIMKNRQAVTTSLQVAEAFDKRHADVIRAIEEKMNSTQNCVQYQNMYAEGVYQDKSGKSNKMYYMNRDGFAFIAFGFSGQKADAFKLKYLNAFNKMEGYIKSAQAKRINSDLEEIKRMNATARLMNAKSHQAEIYMDLSKDATTEVNKVLLQDKAVEVLNGEKLLEIPTLRQHLYDSDQIAKKVGVYSKNGKPHGTAVSQLIKREIFIEEDESEIVPEATNHWGGSVTKYAESVIDKVEAWLWEHDYPAKIKGLKKDYHVQYEF